jgi:hypothetical protein
MKRTNRSQAPMETFLVGKSNQALVVSGDLVTAGTSLNIADGQLGVLSADPNGTVKPGKFIPAATTAANVKAIEIIQGTPNSSQTTEVNAFGIGHKAYVRSGVIAKDKIRSVSTLVYQHPRYSIWYLSGVSALAANTSYYATITLEGERIDTTHGMNREVIRQSVKTPATLPTDAADFVLQNLALKINQSSKFVNPNTNYAGNKPIVAFGVKSSGGSGTTIGTLTKNTAAFNFAKYTVGGSAIQSTFKTDLDLINSLKTAIGSVSGLSTATIENLGNVAPGSASTVDGLLIIAFREKEIAAFDDVKELSIRADVNFGAELGVAQPTYTLSHVCTPSEGVNTGRQVYLRYADRAEQQIFTLQNWPINGKPYPVPENYLSKTGKYTVTIIEYYDNDNVISGEHEFVKTAVICLPAAISDETVSASTGLTIATSDTATVTALNNTLSAWIAGSANVQYLGSAVSGTIFV